MRADEVSTGQVVVDSGGDVWAHKRGRWGYINDRGEFSSWDTHSALPSGFEPYVALSEQAARAIKGNIA
ncbi:hypothetical protein GS896_25440 [Rhodococcus hoagii]|nr:hypothetical protein [Prescottella equi]MBM4654151.1 hypothetical protein [Prescottella equi]MBM4719624.1 hypothetical protein [Prescottella equi]NKR23422.1 hypothetical protein [Prescottella equi]NKT55966.1 hypothetical protein [Prescottella equi]